MSGPDETWRDLLARIGITAVAYMVMLAVVVPMGILPGVISVVGLVVSLAVNVAYGPVRAALLRRGRRRNG